MSKIDSPKLVVALYSFKGKNNDELCFKKDDIITITQLDDGGWWEGTLHDKTGWFPSNYVKDYKATDTGPLSPKLSPDKNVPEIAVNQKLNRDIVLKDIVDSERAHVVEMQSLMNNFLQTVETSNVLKKDEYKQLTGNLPDILDAHQRLLTSLDNALLQGVEAKVGNLFLAMAPRLKLIHTTYCSGHPQAVCILDRYRDELNEFMERNGVVPPGILVLTTGLSKPFRRLEKYSTMLQELERHTEKNHPDRGDTQRCVSVYREISDQCAAIRKQRELALHILTSGIKGWEGEELSSLGDVIYVGPVTLITGGERSDRYFVLFSSTLLMLSTSPRMSSFVYEGKLPLTGIRVVATKVDDTKNSFEISGPMIDNISVLCSTKEERRHWIELLNQEPGSSMLRSPTMLSHVSYICVPYKRLSRYFARLVRKKIITVELMKKLLYLQYVLRPDLSEVRMRRRRVTYAVLPATSSCSSSCSNVSKPRRTSTLQLDVRYVIPRNPFEHCLSLSACDTVSRERLSESATRSLPARQPTQSPEELDRSERPFELRDDQKTWKSPKQQRRKPDELWQQLTSLHSSDSGMADSCYRQQAVRSESSDADENKFEHQCVCTSPFGSSPTSSSSSLASDDEDHPRRQTVPLVHPKQPLKRIGSHAQRAHKHSQVFTSGLYAHWWLKRTIALDDESFEDNNVEWEVPAVASGAQLTPRD